MHQKALFNNYTEFDDNNLESIIREYFVTHQQTENTFLNGLEQLNQLRVQTQSQNWSNFLIKLHQFHSSQNQRQLNSNQNNNKFFNPLFNINHNNNTTSITIQPPNNPTNSINNDNHITLNYNDNNTNGTQTNGNSNTKKCDRKNDKKSVEYYCELNNCNKIYTTKGNLNRHLKDFHGLNSDLTPRENSVNSKSKSIESIKINKSSPPPKPPMPTNDITPTKVDSITNSIPFPLVHLNNNTKIAPLSLPMFNLNKKKEVKVERSDNKRINKGYNGLEILLQAMNALDEQSKDKKENSSERKRKYDRMNGNGMSDKKVKKKRKLNVINSESDERIKKDFEIGICSLCNKNRGNNLSNYNWINHLQSDHKYKCNIVKCKCKFTQKQYLNEHIEKIHK